MRRLPPTAAIVLAALPALAQQRGSYLGLESGGLNLSGYVKWILLIAALGGIGHLCYHLWTTKLKNRPRRRSGPPRKVQVVKELQERATTLGFRQGEARTVQKIAMRLAPKTPVSLLNSNSGREYLIGDLERRIGQREREIKVLGKIRERLVVLREQDVQERESVRVDANISVWVSKRGLSAQELSALVEDEDEAEGEGEGEGMFANLDSVAGRLLDISEGGAAIEIEMDVDRGEQVQFWSGDPHVMLGETRAGIVSLETREGKRVLHLHFIDPDLRELRGAIGQLRGGDADDDEDE